MSTLTMPIIQLEELTQGEVRNLAGHERGLAAREHFHLDELDVAGEAVDVCVPPDFRAVSPSFFQGMFAESVHRFGSAEAFFNHYHFDAPVHIRARLAEYAEQLAGR